MFSRGQRLDRRGRTAEASEALEAALELLDWDPENPPVTGTARARLIVRVLVVRAANLTSQGKPNEGFQSLAWAEPFADARDRGMLLHQRALILWLSGRPRDSLQWFDAAEPYLEEHGPDWMYAGLFVNRGGVWRDLGEVEKGLQSTQNAVELYTKMGSPVHRAKAMHQEALHWFDLGEVTRALQTFDEVRTQYREHSPELEGYLHGSYADALLSVGLYSQAVEHWSAEIEIMRSSGNRRDAAIAEFWRAVVAFEDNQFELAGAWAKQAMDSLYQQGNEPMAFLAQLLILQGQFDSNREGSDFADKVSRLCDALESRGWALRLAQTRVLAARARIRSGDLEEAEARLHLPPESKVYETLAESLAWHLAKAELAEARGEDPLPYLRQGLDLLDTYRVEFGSVEFQAGVSALGIKLASKGLGRAGRGNSPGDTLEWAERSRAQVLRIPPVKSSADSHVREVLGRLRQARQQIWAQRAAGEDPTGFQSRVRELEEEIRTYDRGRPGPRRQEERITPEVIHGLAQERETVLVTMLGIAGRLCAVLAGGDELRQVQLMDTEEAAEAGRRLGADLDALGSNRLPDMLRLSVERSLKRNTDALAAGIWDPISDYVGDRQVVFVPHSQIAWVPWPLLPPLRGRPLTVAPSAEAWWRAATRTRASGPALVAAGPALNRAGAEIVEVAELYPGSNLIPAEKSDPEVILQSLDGASVAHLAAHGNHEPENVLFSRLNFAQGPLNAYELLGLDQPPAHVVLSSCDLGRSTVTVGHETLGFTAALLHAGTSTVVSSLGRVPDDLAAEMMIDYHRRCAAGATPAEALAAVGENRPWHPFVCFGA